MAGKGPRYQSKDGYHRKESHHSKDGPRRGASPGRPSVSGSFHASSSKLDHDGSRSMLGPPLGGQTPPILIEQKLAMQHAEIQRLLGENQRLAVTHVALRQEFSAAQQEIMHLHQSRQFSDPEKEQRFTITQVALRQELADAKQEVNRLQEAIGSIQSEKDEHIRMAVERGAQIEAELKAAESLKPKFDKLRYERDELVARVDHLSGEVKKLPQKDQEIAALKSEIDELRQRHQQARMDFEHQKKINLDSLEQKQTMEKNNFTMAREIDKLRAELMNMERKLHNAYPAPNNGSAPAVHNSALTAGPYENKFVDNRQMPQAQGQIAQNAGPEHGLLPTPPPPLPPLQPVHQQLPSSQQVLSPPTMQQSGQHSPDGVNLLVLGLSEGITDRDLASLFHPYGNILYAKVMMDSKSGSAEYYGVVTMENQQVAEAAASAVNGMFILGRHIKVEVQTKEQYAHSQKAYPQQAMQQGMMQGVGPVRWPQRSGGRWPY